MFLGRDSGTPSMGTHKGSAGYVRQGDDMMDRNVSSRMEEAAQDAQGSQAQWLSAMRSLAEQIQKQQQYSQQMTQELINTYMQLLNTPGSYLSGQAQEQQQSFQQMAQEVVSTYSELFNIPLTYAQEGLKDAQFPH